MKSNEMIFDINTNSMIIIEKDIPDLTPEQLAQQSNISEKINSISMRQCRLVLLNHNLLDQVDLAISNMPRSAQIEWEYATTVDRGNPLVQGIIQLLNLTEQQMDDMFVEASLI